MLGRDAITGLVLAGGRASRMGGTDKGLERWGPTSMAAHAIARLRPQVSGLLVSANRNLEAYRALGVDIVTDAMPDFPGPLAGVLAGLQASPTPWLAVVPCDAPRFPIDLVARLVAAIGDSDVDAAVATTGDGGESRLQPTFCLLHRRCAPGLAAYLSGGERRAGHWLKSLRHAIAGWPDRSAFANVNTRADLLALSADE